MNPPGKSTWEDARKGDVEAMKEIAVYLKRQGVVDMSPLPSPHRVIFPHVLAMSFAIDMDHIELEDWGSNVDWGNYGLFFKVSGFDSGLKIALHFDSFILRRCFRKEDLMACNEFQIPSKEMREFALLRISGLQHHDFGEHCLLGSHTLIQLSLKAKPLIEEDSYSWQKEEFF